MKTISAREANQAFSKLLAAAAAGEEFVITRRGTPVAKLVPVTGRDAAEERQAAGRRMMRRMRQGARLGGIKVPREQIYQR